MKKILIADDEPNLLLLSSMIFKDAGYEVITAINGEEAIDKFKSEAPDLVITDLMMPKKNGHEVIEAIRKDSKFSKTPVILCSAVSDQMQKGQYSADDFLSKPFSVDDLKNKVKKLLG
jgi:DNA-binding response OmpR family regulator